MGKIHGWYNRVKAQPSNPWQKASDPEAGLVAVGVTGGKRPNIRLADLNGDKRFDYIDLSFKNGAFDAWINNINDCGSPTTPGDTGGNTGGQPGSSTDPGQYGPGVVDSPIRAGINAITCTSLAPGATLTISGQFYKISH